MILVKIIATLVALVLVGLTMLGLIYTLSHREIDE